MKKVCYNHREKYIFIPPYANYIPDLLYELYIFSGYSISSLSDSYACRRIRIHVVMDIPCPMSGIMNDL